MNVPPLSEILGNRRWVRHKEPFPHVLATNVFTERFYRRLESSFQSIWRRGLNEHSSNEKLSRNIPGYDAYGLGLNSAGLDQFAIFKSRVWHDVLAGLFAVEATGHINCGLHHHTPGSLDGWVHNDLNPGWFADARTEDGIVLVNHRLCSYTSGAPRRAGVDVVEVIRAVAMIYYIGNGPWPDGIAGGTGLYKRSDQPVSEPDAVVLPNDNSMLVFECTPFSFHSFIGRNPKARNSVIMWLHRPKAEVVARWGERSIRGWQTQRRGRA
jgi:hypothetical protein